MSSIADLEAGWRELQAAQKVIGGRRVAEQVEEARKLVAAAAKASKGRA
jgi:hypothetical protein